MQFAIIRHQEMNLAEKIDLTFKKMNTDSAQLNERMYRYALEIKAEEDKENRLLEE